MRSIYDIDGLRVVTGPLHWMCLGPFGISHPYKIRRNAAMNRFIILAMVCLMTSMTFAAQCAGLTKKGERCKREAAEGSKYCIGHADQEKSATRLKDDGTCWAVTEAGTRCKHKKDGESDYCKQHNADTKAKKAGGQCRALKWDGARCTRTADGEYIYCKQHRKQPAAQKPAETKSADKKPAEKKPAAKKNAAKEK